MTAVIAYLSVFPGGLLAYSYYTVTKHAPMLATGFPAFAEVERPIIVFHVALLSMVVLAAFLSCSYITLVVINQVRQFRARRKARLKAVAAQFHRDEWIGLGPGLSPGGEIYECLFAAAPAAHHELEGKGG
jgi:hypothetical protein